MSHRFVLVLILVLFTIFGWSARGEENVDEMARLRKYPGGSDEQPLQVQSISSLRSSSSRARMNVQTLMRVPANEEEEEITGAYTETTFEQAVLPDMENQEIPKTDTEAPQ